MFVLCVNCTKLVRYFGRIEIVRDLVSEIENCGDWNCGVQARDCWRSRRRTGQSGGPVCACPRSTAGKADSSMTAHYIVWYAENNNMLQHFWMWLLLYSYSLVFIRNQFASVQIVLLINETFPYKLSDLLFFTPNLLI